MIAVQTGKWIRLTGKHWQLIKAKSHIHCLQQQQQQLQQQLHISKKSDERTTIIVLTFNFKLSRGGPKKISQELWTLWSSKILFCRRTTACRWVSSTPALQHWLVEIWHKLRQTLRACTPTLGSYTIIAVPLIVTNHACTCSRLIHKLKLQNCVRHILTQSSVYRLSDICMMLPCMNLLQEFLYYTCIQVRESK